MMFDVKQKTFIAELGIFFVIIGIHCIQTELHTNC